MSEFRFANRHILISASLGDSSPTGDQVLRMFGKKSQPQEETENRGGFIKRLRARLNKGDSWLSYDLANLAPGGKIDEDVLEELESLLVMADVGINTTERIMSDLQKSLARNELKDIAALKEGLRQSPCRTFCGRSQYLC